MNDRKSMFKVMKPYDQYVDRLNEENVVDMHKYNDSATWRYLARVRNDVFKQTNQKVFTFKEGRYRNMIIIKRPCDIQRVDETSKHSWFRVRR